MPAANASPPSASPVVRAVPFLRWAGSKRALVEELAARAPASFGTYVEPFAGSACLFFRLHPETGVLGDRNSSLIATYRTVRARPKAVWEAIAAWDTTSETYYSVRAANVDELSSVQRAARFVYLNRLCFNGVYRTNRAGRFNVPFGRNTGSLPSLDQFHACARALRGVTLASNDFETLVARASDGDFVYLDPPYTRGATDAYGVYGYGSFDQSDLSRLVNTVLAASARGVQVMLSYRDVAELHGLGANWNVDHMAVRTSVGGSRRSRSIRNELVVTNYPRCVAASG